MFDYTAIVDRTRSVGETTATERVCSTSFKGQTFPFPEQPCNQIDAHLEICKYPPHRDQGLSVNHS